MLRRLLALVPFALLAVAASPVLAQSGSGADADAPFTLRGSVVNALHAAIVGARVETTNEIGEPGPAALTDGRGAFALTLPPGEYVVRVAFDGFADATLAVTARRGGARTIDVVLDVAGLQETVSVSAEKAPVGYQTPVISSSTKTATPLRDVPQSVTVVSRQLIQDQLMSSVADVVRYVPGVQSHQGENNRDQVIIRGNSSSADFFVDGVRDDVQYYRDLYNLERVEALKGPNAMIFGRGGGGGVINRVTKEASFAPTTELTLMGGSFGQQRVTADLDRPISSRVAIRLNAMYENADSFRDAVNLDRYGVNPTITYLPDSRTKVTVSYEHYRDNRVADRGLPSYQGRPVDADISTYFGNPADSHVNARADVASAAVERQFANVTLHNRTLLGDYERGYQNDVPGAVNASKTQVSLSAYNNDTARLNLFNQTDLTSTVSTGSVRHTLLVGAELGRQQTDNFRNTGYFNNTSTTLLVPYANPTITTPVTWRQSATDADNHVRTAVAAAYAQDQIDLTRVVQVVGGVRFDTFDLAYHNNRTGDDLDRVDHLVSPRAGLVIKPAAALSLYSSYTISWLPSSGDQFSSLTTITEQVKPEKFTNYEAGAKWDLARGLALTTAVYRLDRTNTRATDPNDPTRILQTGGQRTNGYELGISGQVTPRWQIAGGYAFTDAFVTSAVTAAPAGATVAQVPRHTFSLWNLYQLQPKVGVGAGIVRRSDMFAAIDDTVTLPGYTDLDAAVYLTLTLKLRLQANVDNVLNRTFYVNADSNTNISPGAPRALRIALVTRF
ncbi:MAG TPA: TonB-dependent siderophore receptor [Vicinamibacterales bacterium]|nr:TonB-dependent siderophore receptor [Vicinamibacterales bacterium]